MKQFKFPFTCELTVDELISRSESQAGQDLFVLGMFEGKRSGTFLEVGAGDPKIMSNCFLLENSFQWSGYSIDIENKFTNDWAIRPNSKFSQIDATTVDYSAYPKYIDYVQIDLDIPFTTRQVLDKIISQIEFGVMTFEHDVWKQDTSRYKLRNYARSMLRELGYELVVNNVTIEPGRGVGIGQYPIIFEDWFVNPKIINNEIIASYKWIDHSVAPKYPTDILFTNTMRD